MSEERTLGASLQLSVLAALAFDRTWGAAIAAQVRPQHFDLRYRDAATRILRYRREYSRAPGKSHITDLIGTRDIAAQRLTSDLLAEEKSGNPEYAARRVGEFIRRQSLKDAILAAGDRYGQDNESMIEDVEKILYKALRSRQHTVDAGMRLNDPAALEFTEPQDFYSLGIPELDKLRIGATPKQMLLYIAPKNSGKTWFCVHTGLQCMLQRARVVHVSLEMSRLQIIQRYYQRLFSIANTARSIQYAALTFDNEALAGFTLEERTPDLSLRDPRLRDKLRRKLNEWGTRLGGIVVIDYPTHMLTIDGFTSYLDYLVEVQRFVPNVLIVDYPDLMSLDLRNYRLEVGSIFENLRGVAADRNCALIVPTQTSRAGIDARQVRATMAAEDIRKVNAADTVLTYSSTPEETRLGLGRLSVDFARHSRRGNRILLAQSYETGQYVLESAVLQQAYWNQLEEMGGERPPSE